MESLEFPSDIAGESAEVWVVCADGAPPRLRARLTSSAAPGTRELADALAEAVLLVDDRGRFVDANAAACRILGYPIEQLLRLSVEDIAATETAQERERLWCRFQQQGSQAGRYLIKAGDGALRLVSYRSWAQVLPGYHLNLLQTL